MTQGNETIKSEEATDANGSVETTAFSSAYKVRGELSDPDGTGVLGRNTAASGTAHGVEGVTASTEPEAAGVYGEATSSGADGTYGVHGVTQSSHNLAAAVRGDATDAIGVKGVSSRDYGVFGLSYAVGRAGVYGENKEISGTTSGIRGIARSGDDGTAGVKGEAFAASGLTYGVHGSSSSGGGYGLYSSDDAKVDGDLEVGGTVSKSTGGEVYLGGSQSVDPGAYVKVAYDTVVTDQRGEFGADPSVFTCANAGDYHVEASVTWDSGFSAETYHIVQVLVNGSPAGKEHAQSGASGIQSINVSKTLFGLSASDTIHVEVWQNGSGVGQGLLTGSRTYTSLTIAQVG